MKPCARCRSPMLPEQNCRRMPDGIICMACYEGPRILYYDPDHNRIVLVERGSGTVRVNRDDQGMN